MKSDSVVHPFLFGLFPVVFLFSHNVKITPVRDAVLSSAVVLVFTLFIWLALSYIAKDRKRAGLSVSAFILLFFSYGQVYDILAGGEVGAAAWKEYALLILWTSCFAYITYRVTRKAANAARMTVFLNSVSALLLVLPVASASYWFIERSASADAEVFEAGSVESQPDIYYIILDAYGRSDVLEEIYHCDNSGFLSFLKSKGFYIAEKARSNYHQTNFSIASSLNFTYLDDLAKRVGEENDDGWPLMDAIHNNRAANFLRKHGYKFVVFSSGYGFTDIREADSYMAPAWTLSEFQNMLINFTPLPALLNRLGDMSQYEFHRRRISYILDNIGNLAEGDHPKFVFAHILAPHFPFVFGENGESANPDAKMVYNENVIGRFKFSRDYVDGYKKQLTYISKRMEKVVDDIISRSKTPPIIIIQGDHGPGSMLDWSNLDKTSYWERMSILNAYYLPGVKDAGVYKDITPVNTFRVIFDRYFGADLPLLKDESYFSPAQQPYKFFDVTERAKIPYNSPTRQGG